MTEERLNKWFIVNAELSVVREEAEKVLAESAAYDLTQAMADCLTSVKVVTGDLTLVGEHHIRKAISVLASKASEGSLAYVKMLEGHNGQDNNVSPGQVVWDGCKVALKAEFNAIHVIWDKINT